MSEKVDVVVVGAGPAGISCAITLAKNGIKPIVIERGEYPGAKNVQGAVLYTHPLNLLIQDFYKTAPLEREVVEQRVHITTEESITTLSFRSSMFASKNSTPANCYTIIRKNFDVWFAKEAEKLGVD
ncbi:MAG: NAD(P)/FAD-dependent oxidoreductase, partial [bacterium]|nr:NAD(P)/FAD-dependent oxidoreductase [bacterium]